MILWAHGPENARARFRIVLTVASAPLQTFRAINEINH